MMHWSYCWAILLYVAFSAICLSNSELAGWDLPILPPPDILDRYNQFTFAHPTDEKFIPRNVWVAVRNSSESLAAHMVKFIQRNHKWNVHIHGNAEKDLFMNTYFANTSVNWVYNKLNPAIGCSRPEIWRLAVLYLFGGLYIDDDSNIDTPLDEVVRPTDKFIIAKEPYDFDDRCYVDSFPLSNHSMNQRFGIDRNQQKILGGKFFLNWAMFTAPKSPMIEQILRYIVLLIKAEYTGRSVIKMGNSDHRGKLLMCATTFPITHVLREVVIANNSTSDGADLGIRVVDTNFKEYGGNMKAWYNDFRGDHWVKVIQKHGAPYLLEYGSPPAEEMNGQVLRGVGQKSIYLIKDGTRHGFQDFGTFMAMNFTLDNVHLIPPAVLEKIPLGDPVPTLHVKN